MTTTISRRTGFALALAFAGFAVTIMGWLYSGQTDGASLLVATLSTPPLAGAALALSLRASRQAARAGRRLDAALAAAAIAFASVEIVLALAGIVVGLVVASQLR